MCEVNSLKVELECFNDTSNFSLQPNYHGGWLVPHFDTDMGRTMVEIFSVWWHKTAWSSINYLKSNSQRVQF